MKTKILLPMIIASMFVGCASVPKSDSQATQIAKQLTPPKEGYASIYVYRSNTLTGSMIKKDIWIDGECLGESSRGVFLHKEVLGNQKHVVSTESEFSPNHLEINTEAGKQYFVQQYIKVGVMVGGANLKQVDEATGKKAIAQYDFAKDGNCSKATIDLSKK